MFFSDRLLSNFFFTFQERCKVDFRLKALLYHYFLLYLRFNTKITIEYFLRLKKKLLKRRTVKNIKILTQKIII